MKRKARVLLYDGELPAVAEQFNRPNKVRPRDFDGLSQIEHEFCLRYTACYEGAKAAIQAGYNPARASFAAYKLLRDYRIKREIARIEQDRFRRMKFDGDEFFAREVILATASATEVMSVWLPPCRYCWGRNFEYQRTHAEFEEDYQAWMRLPERRKSGKTSTTSLSLGDTLVYNGDSSKLPFDQRGGDGYDVSKPPNSDCPNCYGRGLETTNGSVPYVRLKPTDELSDIGKILFAGVKQGPQGVSILLHNQDAARARIMGMLTRVLELRATEGAGVKSLNGFQLGLNDAAAGILTNDPRGLSDEELDALLAGHGVTIDATTTTTNEPEREGVPASADSGETTPSDE